MITPEQLADELGVNRDEVHTLTEQLHDENLYDVESGLLTPDGAAAVRDRLTYG